MFEDPLHQGCLDRRVSVQASSATSRSAPPGRSWRVLLSSEHARYGGMGTPPIQDNGRLHLSGQTALVLTRNEEKKA